MANEYVIKNGLIVGDLNYPATDGTAGDVMTTDGAGNVSLQTPTSGSTGAGSVERVRVNYTAGYDITGVVDETPGVTTTITNAADSIISMTFTGHAYPPTSILIYSQDVALGRFTIEGPAGFGTGTIRYVQGTDVNFGSFSSNGPLELQVDENNLVGLGPDGFTGPVAYILMWFLD